MQTLAAVEMDLVQSGPEFRKNWAKGQILNGPVFDTQPSVRTVISILPVNLA